MVDDQPIVGEGIRRMLATETDIVFHFCKDPARAVETAASLRASVILQDLVMPGIDGMQLVKAYREQEAPGDIPVIVLSSKEDPTIKRDAFARGANDYLVKMPDPVELIARVRAHSRGYYERQELRQVKRELEAKNALLVQLSTTDSLTSVANRRHFDDVLQREWRRCLRNGSPIALILADVDHFKPYNDHYGHQAGDLCLTQVAEAIKSSMLRPGDTVARYGGEEFAVILPETDLEGSLAVAERLQGSVRKLALQHRFSGCGDKVTISQGIASCVPAPKSAPEHLILQADTALYTAKQSGRNRYTAYVEPEAPGEAAAA